MSKAHLHNSYLHNSYLHNSHMSCETDMFHVAQGVQTILVTVTVQIPVGDLVTILQELAEDPGAMPVGEEVGSAVAVKRLLEKLQRGECEEEAVVSGSLVAHEDANKDNQKTTRFSLAWCFPLRPVTCGPLLAVTCRSLCASPRCLPTSRQGSERGSQA